MDRARDGLQRIAANQYASLAARHLRIHDTAYRFTMLDEPALLHREMREFLAGSR